LLRFGVLPRFSNGASINHPSLSVLSLGSHAGLPETHQKAGIIRKVNNYRLRTMTGRPTATVEEPKKPIPDADATPEYSSIFASWGK